VERSDPQLSGVSVGIALYPRDATEPESLLSAADRQMYVRKQAATL
jgi:GGDEF domain-containing protein